ncbi:MAG: RNA polymerase sigma factor [Armatimonadetes bacterium]|nr:RNA polymerase sigma factor [Armatimonadota bacterium]
MRTAAGEDEVLISRFQQGEAEAFDRLMAAHMDKVYALAWGVLQDREEARDAVQEVFIKLYGALRKFPSSDNLSAWLYRVCLNHCIDRKRRAKRSRVDLTDDDWERLQGSENEEPEFQAYQSEIRRMIRNAVETLPERQRLVFVLRHYKLLSINEISETIGCSPGAVKAHLSRATANLRDRLARSGILEAREVERNEL